MAINQNDPTLVRCIKTDGSNRIRFVKRYITQDEVYMKRAKLMVQEVEGLPQIKLSKGKQKEVDGIDERIAKLKKGEQTPQIESKIEDLEQLKKEILNGNQR